MSDLYCDTHDNPLPCWVCNAPQRRAKEVADQRARSWEGGVDVVGIIASYHGRCVQNGDHISPGEMIVKDGDGYSHRSCIPHHNAD